MNREALDNFCGRGILGLVLAILVIGPLAMGAVDAWSFLVVQGLALGVLLLWMLRLWVSPKPQLLWPPICWVALAFLIYAIARYLTADIEYVARQELIQVLLDVLLFFAIVNNLYRQEISQIISFTLIFLAMAIAAVAVCQFFLRSNRVWIFTSPYPGRASGTYISPNNLAGFLEMLLPLGTAYVLAGRMKPLTRIFLAYATLAIAAGLTVTFSRGGWAAAGIGLMALLAVLASHRNHRLPAMLLLVALLGGGVFFVQQYLSKSLTYMERVQGIVEEKRVDLDFRRGMWLAAERMWLDHFWWGVGPAHYDYRFREYRPEKVQARPDRVHNDYLNLLADWGAAGGIIVLAGMAAFSVGLWQTRRHVQRAESDLGGRNMSNRFAFFLGASAGLLALAAHSVVDFNLHIPANALLGVTLLALLTSNVRFATERYWWNARLPLKLLATIIIMGGAGYLGWQGWRRGVESHWLARADAPGLMLLDRAAILEKAFAAEPQNSQTAYDIGEAYYMQSLAGDLNTFQAQGETALRSYEVARRLNPYDGYSYLRAGMCLDWLERHAEAGPFYRRAESLDPNGYFTVANIGWHYFQVGDYLAAREWLERSLHLEGNENTIGHSYLKLTEQKLAENASGKGQLPPGF